MSSSTPANIVPFVITNTQTASSFSVQVLSLELFTSVNLFVRVLDNTGNTIETKIIFMGGDDYQNWLNDDTFVLDFVATTLGTTVVPPE